FEPRGPHERGKTVEAPAHIGGCGEEVDPDGRRQAQHRAASSTIQSAGGSTSPHSMVTSPTRTTIPAATLRRSVTTSTNVADVRAWVLVPDVLTSPARRRRERHASSEPGCNP